MVDQDVAMIAKELVRFNIDIASLSETRFADAGYLHKKGYTFYWTTPLSALLLQND